MGQLYHLHRARGGRRPFVLPLFAIAALAGGCSQLELGYMFLDTFIERRFSQYLALTPSQESLVAEFADSYQVWHRGSMLPRYVELLRSEARLHDEGRFTRVTFDRTRAQAEALYKSTLRPFIPQVAQLLTAQSAHQRTILRERLDERIDEFRERAAERTPESSLTRLEEQLADFIGPLNDQQRTVLRARTAAFLDGSTAWIDERARRDRHLLGLLERGDVDAVEQFLAAWWLEPMTISPPAYRERTKKLLETVDDVIFAMLALMNDEQREQWVRTLRDYAEDLDSITS